MSDLTEQDINGWIKAQGYGISPLKFLQIASLALDGLRLRWIPVTERLPEEYVNVLLYWESVFPLDVGLWNGKDWQRANDGMEPYDAAPRYWMPLPDLPIADQSQGERT